MATDTIRVPVSWKPLLQTLKNSVTAEIGTEILRQAITQVNRDASPALTETPGTQSEQPVTTALEANLTESHSTVTLVLRNQVLASIHCLGQRWPVDKPLALAPEEAQALEAELCRLNRYAFWRSVTTTIERL